MDIGAIFFKLNRHNTVIPTKFVIQLILLTCFDASIVYAVVKSSFFTILTVFYSTSSSTSPVNPRRSLAYADNHFYVTLASL